MKITALILGIIFLFLMINPTVLGQGVVDISILAISGAPGDTITVPVNIGNTTDLGIIAVEIFLQYDSNVLSAIDAGVSGTIAGTWQVVSNVETPGEISIHMIWTDPQTGPLSGSGALVNIKFLVKSTAQVGATSELRFDKDRTRLNDGTPGVVTYDGLFTVGQISPGDEMEGDANGDNRVDHRDLLMLILMYSKSSGDSGYDPSADLNGDGVINHLDMIILLKNFGATGG